jgi:NAD dependent epimerase/dehydratase family enzyme
MIYAKCLFMQLKMNKELAEKIGEALDKSALILPAPAFAMRLAMGEMADIVLDGARLSPAKIEATGYRTLYDHVKDALRDIIERKV